MGIISGLIDIGLVTTTYNLVVNHDIVAESNVDGTVISHTTHVSTTIEGAEIGGVWLIDTDIIEDYTGHDVHRHTIHILVKLFLLGQIHLAEVKVVVRSGILFQNIFGHHVGTVITQEHLIGNHIGSNLQLRTNMLSRGLTVKRSTVTTAIDGATNDGLLLFRSDHTDSYSLGIGTEGIQSLHRGLSCRNLIVKIAIDIIVLQIRIIRIRIRTITSTIDITLDVTMNTYSITTIDIAGDIITTIDIVDITSLNQDTGSITCRQEGTFNGLRRNSTFAGVHIGHTTTTKDVIDLHAI